jgi:hypothetical protein
MKNETVSERAAKLITKAKQTFVPCRGCGLVQSGL